MLTLVRAFCRLVIMSVIIVDDAGIPGNKLLVINELYYDI